MGKIYIDKGTIVNAMIAKGYMPVTTTGTDKGMTVPNARRSLRRILHATAYDVVNVLKPRKGGKKMIVMNKEINPTSARAAAIRHKERKIT